MKRVLRLIGFLLVVWFGGIVLMIGVGTLVNRDVIAFDSNRRGNYDIYLLDLRTGVLHNMTRHPAQDRSPAWSPDGRYIAFESSQRSSSTGIYVIDTHDLSQPPRRITPTFLRAVQPDWSPTGYYLVFSGSMNNLLTNEIFLINLYDRRVIRVTESELSFKYGPVWSPSGDYIAYGSYDESRAVPSDVFVVRFVEMATQLAQERPRFEPVRVSDNPTAADPFWTSDENILLRYAVAPYRFYITEPRPDHIDEPINEIRSVVEKPALSPDGAWLIYASANDERDLWRQLAVARRDGSGVRWVTFGGYAGNYWDNAPAWMPR